MEFLNKLFAILIISFSAAGAATLELGETTVTTLNFLGVNSRGYIDFAEFDPTGKALGPGYFSCGYNKIFYNPAGTLQSLRAAQPVEGFGFSSAEKCLSAMENIANAMKKNQLRLTWSDLARPQLDLETGLQNSAQIDLVVKKFTELKRKKIYLKGKTDQGFGEDILNYDGAKSDVVYIYIHGLFLDSTQFASSAEVQMRDGRNSIVLTLPGHHFENTAGLSSVTAQDWVDYTRAAAEFARLMGHHVIVVGQSTGGLLGFILASEKLVDEAILYQPALALPVGVQAASSFGTAIYDFSFGFYSERKNPAGGLIVSQLIQSYIDYSTMLNYQVPTKIYLDKYDTTVDNTKMLNLFKGLNKAPVEVIFHQHGHNYVGDY